MDAFQRCKNAFFGSEGAALWLRSAVKRAREKNLDTFLSLMQDTIWSSQTVAKSTTGKARKMALEIAKKAGAIKAKKEMNPAKVSALAKKARKMVSEAEKNACRPPKS